MNEADKNFMQEVADNIDKMGRDKDQQALTRLWIAEISMENQA